MTPSLNGRLVHIDTTDPPAMKRVIIALLFFVMLISSITPVHAQQEVMVRKISILGNSAIPTGSLSGTNQFGFGGFVQVLSPVAPRVSIGGTTGFLKFGGKDLTAPFLGVLFFEKSPSMSIIPILATGQYTVPTSGKVTPYLSASLGFYRLKADSVHTVFNPGDLDEDGVDDIVDFIFLRVNSMKLGGASGGGVLVELTPDQSWFEVHLMYHIIATETKTTSFLNLGIGAALAFGRARKQ